MSKKNKNYPDVLGDIVRDYTKNLKHEIKELKIRIRDLEHCNFLMGEELNRVKKERDILQEKIRNM